MKSLYTTALNQTVSYFFSSFKPGDNKTTLRKKLMSFLKLNDTHQPIILNRIQHDVQSTVECVLSHPEFALTINPLLFYCASGSLTSAQLFYEDPAHHYLRDRAIFMSALYLICRHGHADILSWLLQNIESFHMQHIMPDYEGNFEHNAFYECFKQASIHGHTEIVKLLSTLYITFLSNKLHTIGIARQGEPFASVLGWNILCRSGIISGYFHAMSYGQNKIADLIIDSLNQITTIQQSLISYKLSEKMPKYLQLCCENGYPNQADALLIAHHIDEMWMAKKIMDCLVNAANDGHQKAIVWALEKYSLLNLHDENSLFYAFYIACLRNHTIIAEKILKVANKQGMTTKIFIMKCDYACFCKCRRLETAQWLLQLLEIETDIPPVEMLCYADFKTFIAHAIDNNTFLSPSHEELSLRHWLSKKYAAIDNNSDFNLRSLYDEITATTLGRQLHQPMLKFFSAFKYIFESFHPDLMEKFWNSDLCKPHRNKRAYLIGTYLIREKFKCYPKASLESHQWLLEKCHAVGLSQKNFVCTVLSKQFEELCQTGRLDLAAWLWEKCLGYHVNPMHLIEPHYIASSTILCAGGHLAMLQWLYQKYNNMNKKNLLHYYVLLILLKLVKMGMWK